MFCILCQNMCETWICFYVLKFIVLWCHRWLNSFLYYVVLFYNIMKGNHMTLIPALENFKMILNFLSRKIIFSLFLWLFLLSKLCSLHEIDKILFTIIFFQIITNISKIVRFVLINNLCIYLSFTYTFVYC